MVIIPLILAEVGPWCGCLAARLLPWAAKFRYGNTERAAVRLEEWSDDLDGIPGQLTKLAYAIGQFTAGSVAFARGKAKRSLRNIQPGELSLWPNLANSDIAALSAVGYDGAHPAGELWKGYQRTIADAIARDRLRFVDCTSGRKLSHLEGLILQSIFVGFVSNALRAHPHEVAVTVSEDTDGKGVPLIRVVVEDDGADGAPSAFEKRSGLARLDDLCRQRGGGVRIAQREGVGPRPRLPSAMVRSSEPRQEHLLKVFSSGPLAEVVPVGPHPSGPAPPHDQTVVSPTPGAVAGVLRGQRHVLRSQIGTPISPAGRVLVESCWQFAPESACSQGSWPATRPDRQPGLPPSLTSSR